MPSPEHLGRDTRSDPFDPESAATLPVFRKVGEEAIHKGWIVTTSRASFVDPDGNQFERDVIRHPGAVAVVPVTDDGAVLLVHQFRPAVNRWLFEVPAGTCDVNGESAETTAQRELAEETGQQAAHLVLLTRCLNTPGFCDEVTEVFLATELHPVPVDRQGIEEAYMSVEAVPLTRFDALVDDGVIVDAVTILGIALARRTLRRPV